MTPEAEARARLAADLSIAEARLAPSPNQGARRGGAPPNMVVLHFTAMARAEDALARLCDPAAEVSAHYLIAADGRIWAMVGESARAWHAGVSIWAGDRDVNSRAVGVELANPGGLAAPYEPFPEPQTARLETLLRALTRRWAIPPRRVLAHSDVAPGRKIDPGPKFDWRRLARAGLAAAPPPSPDGAPAAPAERAAFFAALGRIGYGDWAAEDLLWAFRARFRPEAAGRPLNAGDLAIAAALEAAP